MLNRLKTIPMTITRAGQEMGQLGGVDLVTELTLPVDADVIVGDEISYVLPNGRTRTMTATAVDVLQSPFGNNTLDHTSVKYTVVT